MNGLELSLSSTHIPGMYRALGFIPQHPHPKRKEIIYKTRLGLRLDQETATENNSFVRSQSWVMNLYLWSGATGIQPPSLWPLKAVVGEAGEQEDEICMAWPVQGQTTPLQWRPVIRGRKGLNRSYNRSPSEVSTIP